MEVGDKNTWFTECLQNRDAVWMKRLRIIDSTTITLFSNLLFKGVGRHPKTGKKKGGIKVHTGHTRQCESPFRY